MADSENATVASYGRLAKVGVLVGLSTRVFVEVVTIPASMVVARLLTPHDFGVVAAAGFFVQLAQRMTNFGLNMALVQRKELTPAHTATVFVFNMALGVGMWLALAISAPWLGQIFRSEDVSSTLPVIGLTFPIISVSSVSHALLLRNLNFKTSAAIDAAYATCNAVLAVALALAGFGLWSLIWAQIGASVLQAGLRLFAHEWRPQWAFSWHSLRELLSFGIGLHLKRLLDSAALNVDNLVVGRTLGLTPLGFYDKAFTMMSRAVTLLSSANSAISVRILAIIQEDIERFRMAFRKMLLGTTFVSYSGAAFLAATGPELFYVMFGPRWEPGVLPFQILCAVGGLKALNAYISAAVQSVGRVWGEVQRQTLYLVLIVVGVSIGATWGLIGASVGVLIATSIMSGLMMHLFRSLTLMTWRDVLAPQVPSILCAAGLLVLLTMLRQLLPSTPMTFVGNLTRIALAGLTAGAFALGFIRWGVFGELTTVYEETVLELVPRWAALLGVRPRQLPQDDTNQQPPSL